MHISIVRWSATGSHHDHGDCPLVAACSQSFQKYRCSLRLQFLRFRDPLHAHGLTAAFHVLQFVYQ